MTAETQSQMQHSKLETKDAKLTGITNVNVILGRNGSGKSRFLRDLETGLLELAEFNVRYLSPERAGVFVKSGGVDTQLNTNKNWLRTVRNKNQSENFKAVSAYLLRELELLYLRKHEGTCNSSFKAARLDKINRLLTNIAVERDKSDFIFRSVSGEEVSPDHISSGESEAISLATEILHFFDALDHQKFNVLLLDEPDVHLHPDLQSQLAALILEEIAELSTELRSRIAVCIATHSTPMVCAFARSQNTSIGNKHFGVNSIELCRSTVQLMKLAPFFGHPLSQILSSDVPLIVEGEDDERIWQQASRSSEGRIGLFPIRAETVDHQTELETFCDGLLGAIYDSAVAYSLRDSDGVNGSIEDLGKGGAFSTSMLCD